MPHIVLVCETPSDLSVREVSEFLYDLTMLYDRIVMLYHAPLAPITYTPNFYRRWRRLPPGQQLTLASISMGSPLKIELKFDLAAVVAEVGELMMGLLYFIRDWRFEKQKQKRRLELEDAVFRELQHRLPHLSPEAIYFLVHDLLKVAESRLFPAQIEAGRDGK